VNGEVFKVAAPARIRDRGACARARSWAARVGRARRRPRPKRHRLGRPGRLSYFSLASPCSVL